MDIPSFVFQLLEQEIQELHKKWLKQIADKYKLSEESLYAEFLPPLEIIPEKKEKIIICKKQKTRSIPLDGTRCMARIWNRGKGGQCTRKKCESEVYCKQHLEKRRHGSMLEEPPKEVFCNKTKIVYK